MDIYERSLKLHEELSGETGAAARRHISTNEDLSALYFPGVTEPCRRILEDKENIYRYTGKPGTVAVVTDGSEVPGLGNAGPFAALPVLEARAVIYREFGGVNAVPICLNTQNTDDIIDTIAKISPAFGGVSLGCISSPRIFEIEDRLIKALDIPVFLDDVHGTAIALLAAVTNALRLSPKDRRSAKVVINGAGAAGIATAKLMLSAGFSNVILCGSSGIINKNSPGLDSPQREITGYVNKDGLTGDLADAIRGAVIYIGFSPSNAVTEEMIRSMEKDPIVFTMTCPEPEISPESAKNAGALVFGAMCGDHPNRIDSTPVSPGIFKGALFSRAVVINERMKLAAAEALSGLIGDSDLSPDHIITDVFEPEAAFLVSRAVSENV